MKNTVSAGERKAFMAKYQQMVEHLNEVVEEVGEGRINPSMWYIVNDLHDHIWMSFWGIVGDDENAISISRMDLYTPWVFDSVLTLENLDKAEERMEREIREAMAHYDELVEAYYKEKEDESLA